MAISDTIISRLKKAGQRFHSNDNIANFILQDEKKELIREVAEKFESVLRSLVIDIDTDPNARETGMRLAKMYVNEIMLGRYELAPKVTSFPNDDYSGMLVIRSEIVSLCSHHHQTVRGVAYVGIIPSEEVIGLSKYSRIVDHCARRGTLQEQLTKDILDEIKKATKSNDVAVYIMARHGCCENRGISAHSSMTQTCLLSGQFHEADVKKEFFDNISLQQKAASNIS